jgi:hypothetical protein
VELFFDGVPDDFCETRRAGHRAVASNRIARSATPEPRPADHPQVPVLIDVRAGRWTIGLGLVSSLDQQESIA